jgi:SprT protein
MPYVGIPGCERMARNLLDVHGLTADGWTFRWDRAVRRAGQCDFKRRVISLSKPIAELWGPEGMRDTVLHEIAHAKAGYAAAHGEAWKRECRRIGAEPKRCFEVTEQSLMPAPKFIGECPAGHVHYRHRLTTRLETCGVCAPRFDRRYPITWAPN